MAELEFPDTELDVETPGSIGVDTDVSPLASVDEEPEETVEEESDEIPEEIKKAFEQLLINVRNEDRFVRQQYVAIWRRLEYYWNNILDILRDPVTGDYRQPDWSQLEDEIPPRLINIYRPNGEAIIAALTVSLPSIVFHPDDADNPDDIEAAEAYRNIVELLSRHNDASMMLIRLITIFFNQGTAFGYNYEHKSAKFGSVKVPKIEVKDFSYYQAHCPNCGEALDGGITPMQPQPIYQCQSCGYEGPAAVSNGTESIPQIVGENESPKGSIAQKIFSGLQVKVPMSADTQESCGYLLLEFVQQVGLLRSLFKEKAKDINGRDYQREEDQFLKLPLQYMDMMPDNAANVSCLWLRPWQFWELGADNVELIEQLTKDYPDGCYALFINEMLMDVVPENMDEHWTISKNPFSPSLLARPLGENLATVQDIRAELTEIELQTIEYGIPETFVESGVLDMNLYGEGKSKPGMVTQVKSKAGKSIEQSFHTNKMAVLSAEVEPFRKSVDQDAQFVSGAYPSVYGGVSDGGSKTAAEYSQSKAMALQRLGTVWKVACEFWTQFQSKSATEYANMLKTLGTDERFTKREGSGFVNTWIKASALSGRVGRVEPEATEQLPVSWAQKKDAIMAFLTAGVPEILAVLTNPNNAGLMKNITGLQEIYIPGEDDRMRQRKEFVLLSQGLEVPINELVDNHQVHAEILRGILESSQGEGHSPEGMQMSMMHLQAHDEIVAQQEQAQMEQEMEMNQKNQPPNKGEGKANA